MRINAIQLTGSLGRLFKVALIACSAFALHADALASSASSPECGSGTTSSSGDPVAVPTSFNIGSLIIPMDSCYNPDLLSNSGPKNGGGSCVGGASYTCYNNYTTTGNVRLPFGVIYLLAENNIPVSVILNGSKISLTDADFSITPPAGSSADTVAKLVASSTGYSPSPTSMGTSGGSAIGTNTVYYSGMPFVIDGSFAAQALQVLTNFNNANANLFAPVIFHVSNYPFNAPVVAVMASRPKPVLIDDPTLAGFFTESQITSVAAAGTTYLPLSGSGTSYTFTWPITTLGAAPAGCNAGSGVCSSPLDASNNHIVDVIWTTNLSGNVNNWTPMGTFFQKSGVVLGVDDAHSFEASTTGGTLGGGLAVSSGGAAHTKPFCSAVASTTALSIPGYTLATPQYPASNRFFQIDDMSFGVLGNGGGAAAGADGASSWSFASAPASGTQGLSDGNDYSVIEGHPMVGGTQTSGSILYISSLHSWGGKSGVKDAGLHIMYNTLVAGGDGSGTCSAAELTRSSSVANLVTLANGTTGYAEYLGSFDWNVPANASTMGNTLFQANPADYPYSTGHFREYKPAGSYTASTISNTPTCSASSSTSPCNWDAATKMKPFAQRNIYVGTGSFGSYTLATASSLSATDNTIKYISGKLDIKSSSGVATGGILGGIDWSTAAVIEARNVGGFTNRPTIAYVGARDGMLHAFCVAPAAGQSDCYGFSAGQEIWAIIPPGMKAKMDSAYNNGSNMDWSTVNVGGAIRVADMTDKFGGVSTAVTRTILIVGMHDSGYIDALDISDPNPSKVNTDGFRFLWENDGTHVASGATSMPMGPTNGATLAQVSQANSSGVAVVTSATCSGQGLPATICPASVTAGYNTYAIRLSDGQIVSDEQNLYSLKSVLLNSPIPNDVPPLPTSLDTDGDGSDETVYVATLEGKVRRYKLTPQGVTAPTLAIIDTSSGNAPSNVYNANSIGGCATGVACQPIGVSPTIVRNTASGFDVLVATGGADWARQTTDKGDLTATTHQSYVTGFDAATLAQFPSAAFKLGGIQPPVSAAGGSSAGTSAAVPLSLRAYAQLTVAGSDLYADVTSISIGHIAQLIQPVVTPGTYGNVERWSAINTTTPSAYGSILTAGTNYAGGAGSVLETNTTPADAEIFVTGASSSIRQTLSSSSTSLNTAADAVNKAAGGYHPFTTSAWFDLSN